MSCQNDVVIRVTDSNVSACGRDTISIWRCAQQGQEVVTMIIQHHRDVQKATRDHQAIQIQAWFRSADHLLLYWWRQQLWPCFLGTACFGQIKDCSAWNLLPGMKMFFFPKKCWCVAKRWACSSQEIFGELGEFFLMVAPLAEMLLSRGMAFPRGDLTAASACPCLVMTFRDVPKQRTALKDQALTRLTFLSSKS